MRRWLYLLMIAGAFAVHASAAFADCPQAQEPFNVLRVDGSVSSPPGTPDGRSWTCAYPTLQQALAEAEASEGELNQIWVAEGTYLPTAPSGSNTVKTFLIPEGVEILGGFPAGGGDGTIDARDPYTYITTLSGDFGSGSHAYHVVTVKDIVSQLTRLDGFVITGGSAEENENDPFAHFGGGMVILSTTGNVHTRINVVRCRFINNEGVLGGAVGATIPANNPAGKLITANFINCEFHSNTTSSQGGAVYDWTGVLNFSNSLFADNTSGSLGGAIFLQHKCFGNPCFVPHHSEVNLFNCTVANNIAGYKEPSSPRCDPVNSVEESDV